MSANGFFDQKLMDHALNLEDESSEEEPKAKLLDINLHLFEFTAQLKEVLRSLPREC